MIDMQMAKDGETNIIENSENKSLAGIFVF